MCGRYHLNSTPAEVADHFDVDIRDNFPARYNIAPTQPIACIRMNEARQREYALVRWGFIPSWAKKDYLEKMGSRPLINARAETAAEKPTFRSAIKRRRCLIPADGFYEWQRRGDEKQPYAIEREGLFAFAGIWETAIGPDGGEADTAAMLTIDANEDMRSVHHREPVIIEPQNYQTWLETDERDFATIAAMLTASPEGAWRFYPVAKSVNSPRNDGPELLAPIDL